MQTALETKIISAEGGFYSSNNEGHVVWSALNMLEAALCRLQNGGILEWHNPDNRIFANQELPRTIAELGIRIGIANLETQLHFSEIKDGIKVLKPSNAGFELRHDLRSGLLSVQKTAYEPLPDFSSDKEVQFLIRALKEDRIILYQQPIVDANFHQTIRYECLARAKKECGSIALPYEFIPAAERSGLIKNLDIHTLKLSLSTLKANPNLSLASNISFATINDYAARLEIYEILGHNSLHAKNLTIEITETIAIHDFDLARDFCHNVREKGARLSLDDFGSGHTSFKSLRELEIDEVKIDGQYVENIHNRKDAFHFACAIAAICNEKGIETVAERVETQAEVNELKKIGANALQGYFFGRPEARF